MTASSEAPKTTPPARWTPDAWIDEAIYQYVMGREAMTRWVNYGAAGTDDDPLYKVAANCTQRAIAAAAIASAKMQWDMTDG